MRRFTLVLAAVALLPALAAKKPAAPAPAERRSPTVTATVMTFPDGTRTDLTWDGPLLAWAVPKDAAGRRVLYALVGPKKDDSAATTCGTALSSTLERDARLFRFRLDGEDRLELVGSALPHGGLEGADLRGDPGDELILVRAGAIDELADAPEGGDVVATTIVSDPAVAAGSGDPRVASWAAAAHDPQLRLTRTGELRSYGRQPAGGLGAVSSLALPMRLVPSERRVGIETPEVQPLGGTARDGFLFATAPEPIGATRVRTFLAAPDASPRRDPVECWMRLPSPERVLDSTFAVMDGVPVWITTTMSAEKLTIFGEKALRIFPLAADRTRVGAAPRVDAVTAMNIWQVAHPAVVDLDRDGHDDLVLAYWKGLRRSIAALEVYRGEAGGKLAKRREMEIEIDEGDEGFLRFGDDVDGDGRPDLVLLAGAAVVVYPGSGEKPIERPVGGKPKYRVPLAPRRPGAREMEVAFSMGSMSVFRGDPGFGTPRPIDLDGDGRVELVFAGDVEGAGRASIVALRGAPLREGAPSSTSKRFREGTER